MLLHLILMFALLISQHLLVMQLSRSLMVLIFPRTTSAIRWLMLRVLVLTVLGCLSLGLQELGLGMRSY